MTLTDALTVLGASLPANPDLDDDHQRAIRVVLSHGPWVGEFGPEVVVPLASGGIVRRPPTDARGFPLRHIPSGEPSPGDTE